MSTPASWTVEQAKSAAYARGFEDGYRAGRTARQADTDPDALAIARHAVLWATQKAILDTGHAPQVLTDALAVITASSVP